MKYVDITHPTECNHSIVIIWSLLFWGGRYLYKVKRLNGKHLRSQEIRCTFLIERVDSRCLSKGWMTSSKVINSFPGQGRLGDQSHPSSTHSAALWFLLGEIPFECRISASLPKTGICGRKKWLSLSGPPEGSVRSILVHHGGLCRLSRQQANQYHKTPWLHNSKGWEELFKWEGFFLSFTEQLCKPQWSKLFGLIGKSTLLQPKSS